jgi:RNA polymerase primary sigma factor
LTQKLEREPSTQEIANEMSLLPDDVTRIKVFMQFPASLDSEISDPKKGNTLKDIIEDKTVSSPIDMLQTEKLQKQVNTLLTKLSKQERMVVSMRFGLDNDHSVSDEEKSLETIGHSLGLNRDRVRQIEIMAMQKLRQWLSPDNVELTVCCKPTGKKRLRSRARWPHYSYQL